MDDEELLVQIGRDALLQLGYQVETATQPEAALARFAADPSGFALVLTDQTMPAMSGLALADKLREIRPDLPIILMTGYSGSLIPERIEAAGIRRLLLKPASLHSLATAVCAALSAQPV